MLARLVTQHFFHKMQVAPISTYTRWKLKMKKHRRQKLRDKMRKLKK